ncbi:MAG: S41 family peptidase, partial [Saprospiraceae bacterium]|nr:S41 family peptidase [Saprospiraceae bacterium]
EDLRAEALRIAGPARNAEACYPAIHFLINALRPAGDHHSFFMTAAEVAKWAEADSEEAPAQPLSDVMGNFGYIAVPGFHSGDAQQIQTFANAIQVAIRKMDGQDVTGWIVDLRENTGGNMEPMILGLGPLLDPGPLGSLVDVRGQHERWSYADGTYRWDNEVQSQLDDAYTVRRRRPIAVLTSPRTGSSGEIVVISFIGNTRTRSFGQPTWGLTTGNGAFDLPDGARMMLASTVMCDRTGRCYEGPVVPDVEVPVVEGKDAVLEAALHWLEQEPK